MVGCLRFQSFIIARGGRCVASQFAVLGFSSYVCPGEMSKPAENERPAPVMMTAFTSWSF